MNLRNLRFLPDILLKIFGLIPAYVFHNFAKAKMLRLVFWHQALDEVPGAYVEFGVASGNSMRSAEIAERKTLSKSLGIKRIERQLYGFDTFSGFSSSFSGDDHRVWSGDSFSVDLDKVKKRFKNCGGRVKFVKADAQSLGKNYHNEKISDYVDDNFIAIALFDMDLSEPTYVALEFIKEKLNHGSIIIFDEYNGFKSDENLGEFRALHKFLDNNKQFSVRLYLRYGDGGVAFQLLKNKN